MLYITGDTHGKNDIAKLYDIKDKLTADDIVIILGDFGVLWYDTPNDYERDLLEFYNSFVCPVLWLDGNHENFVRIKRLPKVEMFGGTVGKVSANIYHLMRGELYTIAGKTFFVMGGAASIDRNMRTPFISWWPDELPSIREYNHARKTLESVNYTVDYIFTHDAPYVFNEMCYNRVYDSEIIHFLQDVYEQTTFKRWYFGHHHMDEEIEGNLVAVYNRIHTLNLSED